MGWLLLAFLAAGAARPYWHWLVRLRAAVAAGHPLRLQLFFGAIALLWALPVLDGAPRPPDLKTLRRFPLAPASALGCRAVGIALQATTWLALALLLPFAFTAGRAWKAARDLAGLAAFSLVCVSAWSALSNAARFASTTPIARPSTLRWRARSLFLLQLCQFGRYLDLWLTFLLLLPLAGYLAQESASPVAYLFGLGAASALLGSLALNQFGADTPATLLRYRSLPCGAAGLLRASNLAWLALLLVATLPLHLAALRWRGLATVGLGCRWPRCSPAPSLPFLES